MTFFHSSNAESPEPGIDKPNADKIAVAPWAADPWRSVAQTNLALYRQLHAAGFSTSDIAYISKAYELAATLFTCRFRTSGKPFIAHLVGTASILIHIGADRETVAAGLLHAAYDQGQFGIRRLRDKRRRVRSIIGPTAEQLVWRYAELSWNEGDIETVADRIEKLSPADTTALVIQLANDLESRLDHGLHPHSKFSPNAPDAVRIAVARRLGYPALAEAFEQTLADPLPPEVIATIRGIHGASFSLLPPGHRWLQRLLRGLETRLYRFAVLVTRRPKT
jgi:(p)ppGpp synthase/HD superfamily hydrolase